MASAHGTMTITCVLTLGMFVLASAKKPSETTLREIFGWKGFQILDHTKFTGNVFATLSVGNAQQCLRLCWLYKACTVVTYFPTQRICGLTSMDVPDMTSRFQREANAVTFDMRSASVKESKPRGCDVRPCDVDQLCVPVVMSSSFRCLATVHQYCPDPPPVVPQTLALNDGVHKVHYQCPPGYFKSGSRDVSTCDRSTGRWSSVSVSCTFVECPSPPDVINAVKYGSGIQFDAKVSYTCLEGHVSPSTTMTITCQENGQWTPLPAACTFVRCPVPEDIPETILHLVRRPEADRPNGVSEAEFLLGFGAKVIHMCNEGYTSRQTNFTSVCQADGTWSTSPNFRCVKVDCGAPPLVANAWSFVNATSFQARADYRCIDGYQSTETDMHLECGPLGTWGGPEAVCGPVSCGPAPDVEHATVNYNSTVFGAQANYTCDSPGIPLTNGTQTKTCQANGQWSNDTVDCLHCGPPPEVSNATYRFLPVATSPTVHGVVYHCDQGFIRQYGGFVMCTGDSTNWTGSIPFCKLITCRHPSIFVKNADVISPDLTYGSEATYKCHEGFKLLGNETNVTCSDNREWVTASGRPVVCEPAVCGSPPLVENAAIATTSSADIASLVFAYNVTVTYACLRDAVLTTNSDTKRCTTNGRWDDTPVRCQTVPCGTIPEVANANKNVVMATASDPITVTYECVEGFLLGAAGQSTRVCQTDDTWSADEVVCERVDCGMPPEVANVSLNFVGTTYGMVAVYECLPGYRFIGQSSYSQAMKTCRENGTWAGQPFECQLIDCGRPQDKTNAILDYSATTPDSVATYTCLPGFSFGTSDTTTLTCSSAGTWVNVSGADLTCNEINCGIPPNKDNSDVKYDAITADSVATYTCRPGFSFGGDAKTTTLTCSSMWMWIDVSGANRTCDEIDCGIPREIDLATISYTTTTYSSRAVYTCDDRYNASGSNVKICNQTGSWGGDDDFRCLPKKCPALTVTADMRVVFVDNESMTVGSTAVFSCVDGYQLAKNISNTTCLESLEWSHNEIECVPLRCGVVPWVLNTSAVVFSINQTVIAEYSCNPPFLLIDDVHRRSCPAGGGNWSEEFIECKQKHEDPCPEPERVDNSVRTYSSRRPGADVVYHCDTGYKHWFFESRRCLTSGEWDDRKVACVMVHCGEPPAVVNATADYNDTVYGSKVDYTCAPGFRYPLQGSKVCQEDGKWSDDVVECLENNLQFCPVPTGGDFATVTFSSLIPGASPEAVVTCHPGYYFHTRSYTLTCGADLQWHLQSNTAIVDKCRVEECPLDPTKVPYAEMVQSGSLFGDTATFVCNAGYTRAGPKSLKCLESGQWERKVIECIPSNELRCPEPETPEDALVTVGSYRINGELSYECASGYFGSGKAYCKGQGRWEWQGSTCRPVNCPLPPPMMPDAEWFFSIADTVYESVVAYECDDQYRQIRAYRSVCLAGGVWKAPSESPCRSLNTCAGPILDVPNAVGLQGKDHLGLYMSYTCKTNYEPSPSSPAKQPMIRRCLWTGQWSRQRLACQPTGACAEIPELPGAVLVNLEADDPNSPVSISAFYRCIEGFYLSRGRSLGFTTGLIELTCSPTNGWSDPNSECLRMNCGSLSTGTTDGISTVVLMSNTTTYESEALYTCRPPAVGWNISVCQADGQWSQVQLQCRQPCNQPPSLAFGNIRRRETTSGDAINDEALIPIPALERSKRSSSDQWDPPPTWEVACEEGFTYLGPEVSCVWNATSQADVWSGVDEATCEKTLFKEPTAYPIVYSTRLDKRKYFNVIKLCAFGTYRTSDTIDALAFFTKSRQLRRPLLIVRYDSTKVLTFLKREIDSNGKHTYTIFDEYNTEFGNNDPITVCITADYQKRTYQGQVNDITLEVSDDSFDEADTTEIRLHNKYNMDRVTVQYIQN